MLEVEVEGTLQHPSDSPTATTRLRFAKAYGFRNIQVKLYIFLYLFFFRKLMNICIISMYAPFFILLLYKNILFIHLTNQNIMLKMKRGKCEFDFIEVMACPRCALSRQLDSFKIAFLTFFIDAFIPYHDA